MSHQHAHLSENRGRVVDVEKYYHWLENYIDIEEHPERLKDFFLRTSDPYSQCVGLEYLSMYGYDEELRQLVKKNKKHKNKLNQEWAALYELIFAKQKRTLDLEKLLHISHKFKTNDPALKCIQLMHIISIHFSLYENEMIANRLDELTDKVNRVSHPILTPLINQRMKIVLFHYYWKRNEMILARKQGFDALRETANNDHLASLHTNLGLSYIFDDFESANFHMNEGLRLAKERNKTRLINIIEHQNKPFIYAHFSQPNNIITPVKSEQAHLAIAKGDLLTARQILSEVTEDTPYTKYYLGRAYEDRRLLIQSYNEFLENRSDHFFARLPLTALKKM